MKYLLGIDFGGSSSKATLLDETGHIAAEESVEYATLHPAPGYCEQRPQDWMRALCHVTQALVSGGIDPHDIAAVAVDAATHTAVLCDENDRPLRPAIHWTDSRAVAEARELEKTAGRQIFALTYQKPDPIWTLPQLLWVKRHEEQLFSRIARIYFEKDYIRFCLTGVWCTDYIEAEGSMLYDCTARKWSETLCALAGLSVKMLPPIQSPTDIIGTLTEQAAAATGLAAGTPVVCGTTDTALEVLAAGAIRQGDTTVKLATAGRICVMTDRPYPDKNVVNYSHIIPGLWYPGAATKAAAASLRWFRDTFGGDYAGFDAAAADIPIGAEGLIYHPYINGELTPYADPTLQGSFVGLRAAHTRAHFVRSVLEGVAFSLLHAKQELEKLGMPLSASATLIGGGAKSPLWQKITADCLDMTLSVTQNSDSSLGSAMLAGVAIGIFSCFEEAVRKCVRLRRTIVPEAENTAIYRQYFTRYVKIHDALAPIYHEETT